MVGVRLEAGVVHPLHAPVAFENTRHLPRRLVVAGDAHRQRLQPAGQRKRGHRVEHAAEVAPHQVDLLQQRPRTGDHAGRHVGVAVQVLGGALHRQVDAERQRLLVDRAGEGVVEDGQHAGVPAGLRHTRDVEAAQGRVDRRFDPADPRLRAEERRRPLELVERRESDGDLQRGQHVVDQVERAAVDGRAAQQLVARLQERQHQRRRGRHPRREHQRRLGTVERGQLLLGGHHRRVGVARVEVLAHLPFLVAAHLVGVLEEKGRGLVDRDADRIDAHRHILAAVDQLAWTTPWASSADLPSQFERSPGGT